MDYLAANKAYWERGYPAVNVDHNVFRFYGRILKHPPFGLTGFGGERLVDFGCGQGAAVDFFVRHGFNARGVDISETDINTGQTRYPHIRDRLQVCDPKPAANECYGFGSDVAVVTAIQALYYLTDTDFAVAIDKLRASMRRGGVFYATMIGEQAREFYENSRPSHDGLRVVSFKNDRLDVADYYCSFIRDEEHLRDKFRMFKPIHVGYYSAKFRSDEGDGFHWTFCGLTE